VLTIINVVSTLSSTFTLAEIQASYYDNASYEEDSSIAKARAFVTACRFLLLKIPKTTAQGSGDSVEMNIQSIQSELSHAQTWVSNNNTANGGGVRFSSFEDFRT